MRNVITRELALDRRDSFDHKVGIRCFDVKNVGNEFRGLDETSVQAQMSSWVV